MMMTKECFIEKHIDLIENNDWFEYQFRNNLRIIQ